MRYNAGVIGYPVDHSLSPTIHNAIYKAMGILWTYGIYSAPTPEDAAAFMQQGKSDADPAKAVTGAAVGFNVTTPYKVLAYEQSDFANLSSQIVGGANTLTFVHDAEGAVAMCCDTTDGDGACRALANAGAPVGGANILICGTGAAALSIMVSAAMRGASSVHVASRNVGKAESTIGEIVARADDALASGRLARWGFSDDAVPTRWHHVDASEIVVGYDEAPDVCRSADIIVNATPVGMHPGDGSPLPSGCFKRGQMLMDAVYARGTTKIVEDALASGAHAIDGLAMLVEQALLSMSVWMQVQGYGFSTLDSQLYEILRAAGVEVPGPSGDA